MIGTGMAADLTAAGKTGVAINAMYDFWSPGAALSGVSRRPADPDRIGQRAARLADHGDARADPDNALGYNPRERSWNYLEPWMGGTWHLRDIIDYQLIALESLLYQAAVQREDLLRNFYQVEQAQRGANVVRMRFVIPATQRDPGAARRCSRRWLRRGGDRASIGRFSAGGKQYATGSYVIRMQQPYRAGRRRCWSGSIIRTCGCFRAVRRSGPTT